MAIYISSYWGKKEAMLNPCQNHSSEETVNVHINSGVVGTAVLLFQPIRFIFSV